MEIVIIGILAAALLAFALVMLRVFANVGPRALEDYARQTGVVYIPVEAGLAATLADWSKPVQLQLSDAHHPLLRTLIVRDYRVPEDA